MFIPQNAGFSRPSACSSWSPEGLKLKTRYIFHISILRSVKAVNLIRVKRGVILARASCIIRGMAATSMTDGPDPAGPSPGASEGLRAHYMAIVQSSDDAIILLTGWGQRMISEGDVPVHVDRVLGKPPRLRMLREALARSVAGAGTRSDA